MSRMQQLSSPSSPERSGSLNLLAGLGKYSRSKGKGVCLIGFAFVLLVFFLNFNKDVKQGGVKFGNP